MRGNAQLSEARSVPRESALMIPEPVLLSSVMKMLVKNEEEGRPPLILAAALIGAQTPSTSAE